MSTSPKPGPSGLHSIILKSAAAMPPSPRPADPGFRELAKHHARAAAELATDADNAHPQGMTDWADLLDLAQAHAAASLACSSVAPVARRRLDPNCKAAK